jgi:hypothetical protein
VLGVVVAVKVEDGLDDVIVELNISGMFLVDVVHRGHLLLQIKQTNKLGDLRENEREERGQGKTEPEEHHRISNM